MTCSCCVWVYQFTPLGYAFINDEVSSQGIQGTREGHIMKNPTSVTWKRHWLNFWFWPGLNSANMPSTTFAQQALCKQGTIREKKLFTIDNHLNDSPSCFYKANDTRYQSLDQKIYQLHTRKQQSPWDLCWGVICRGKSRDGKQPEILNFKSLLITTKITRTSQISLAQTSSERFTNESPDFKG